MTGLIRFSIFRLMQDKIFLNPDGYIEVQLIGDQTPEFFQNIYADYLSLEEQLRSEGKPVLALFDVSRETGFSLSSNKAALEILEKANYDRVAMYQVPHYKVTEGIIAATGKSDNTRLFANREEALAWLKS